MTESAVMNNLPMHDEPTPDHPIRLMDAVAIDSDALDTLLDEEDRLPSVTMGLLLVSITGLVMHGLVVGLTAVALPDSAGMLTEGTPWLWMPLAFVGAFIGTLGVCLPSFWFYTQLAGLDATFRWVSTQALRVQAHASILLFGTLPLFAVAAFWAMLTSDADHSTQVLRLGMALPFFTGLFGVRALHRAFGRFVNKSGRTIPRRGGFLQRLVICWGGLYTLVAPVALWRLCEALSAGL